jgi:hypothetical protein
MRALLQRVYTWLARFRSKWRRASAPPLPWPARETIDFMQKAMASALERAYGVRDIGWTGMWETAERLPDLELLAGDDLAAALALEQSGGGLWLRRITTRLFPTRLLELTAYGARVDALELDPFACWGLPGTFSWMALFRVTCRWYVRERAVEILNDLATIPAPPRSLLAWLWSLLGGSVSVEGPRRMTVTEAHITHMTHALLSALDADPTVVPSPPTIVPSPIPVPEPGPGWERRFGWLSQTAAAWKAARALLLGVTPDLQTESSPTGAAQICQPADLVILGCFLMDSTSREWPGWGEVLRSCPLLAIFYLPILAESPGTHTDDLCAALGIAQGLRWRGDSFGEVAGRLLPEEMTEDSYRSWSGLFRLLGYRAAHWLLRALREGRPATVVEQTILAYQRWLGPPLDIERWEEPAMAAKLEFLAAFFSQLAGRPEVRPTLLAHLGENQLEQLANLWLHLASIFQYGYGLLPAPQGTPTRLPWTFPRFLEQIAPAKLADAIENL